MRKRSCCTVVVMYLYMPRDRSVQLSYVVLGETMGSIEIHLTVQVCLGATITLIPALLQSQHAGQPHNKSQH